jgi:hypothetical protein
MKTRTLIAAAAGCVVLVACGMALAQPRSGGVPPGASPPGIPAANPIPAGLPSPVPVQNAPVEAAPKPDDMSIDQLIDAVEQIRTQKADLEKKEQAMLKTLRTKAAKQKERIDGLDVGQPPAVPTAIPPVSSY